MTLYGIQMVFMTLFLSVSYSSTLHWLGFPKEKKATHYLSICHLSVCLPKEIYYNYLIYTIMEAGSVQNL